MDLPLLLYAMILKRDVLVMSCLMDCTLVYLVFLEQMSCIISGSVIHTLLRPISFSNYDIASLHTLLQSELSCTPAVMWSL